MKKYQNIVLSFFCTIIIFSCSKNEVVPTETRNELLIKNVWKANKITEIKNGISVIKFERGVTPSSVRDDLGKVRISFLKDGTYTSINADNGTETGLWKFTNNDFQIEINNTSKNKVNVLYMDTIGPGVFKFSEKDGINSVFYELIPE